MKDLDERVYFKKKQIKQTSSLLYIPNKNLISNNCMVSLQKDFELIDFTYEDMKQAFIESVNITLSKFNVDKIDYNVYPYFKAVLNNKIKYYTDLFIKTSIF